MQCGGGWSKQEFLRTVCLCHVGCSSLATAASREEATPRHQASTPPSSKVDAVHLRDAHRPLRLRRSATLRQWRALLLLPLRTLAHAADRREGAADVGPLEALFAKGLFEAPGVLLQPPRERCVLSARLTQPGVLCDLRRELLRLALLLGNAPPSRRLILRLLRHSLLRE
jgi:hypothetical protein